MGLSAIYMIIGFMPIFLFVGKNMTSVSVQALDNALSYYETSQRYNIAGAGANFACTELFLDKYWRTGYTNVAFNSGAFNVTVTDTTLQRVKIVSTGTYQNVSNTVIVILQPSSFSKFAYFSDNEPSTIFWQNGDTVWGPYHSNTKLYYNGKPVFNGKVTTRNGRSGTGTPKYNGGYETGVSMPLPTNLAPTKDSAISRGHYQATVDTVWATFNADGTITVKVGAAAPTTTALTTFAPNGVIAYEGAVLRIKGTVSGQVSISTITNGSGKGGKVFIDDDIKYKTNPVTNPSSTDLLGIIATKEILVANTAANNVGGIDIHAALYSQTKGIGAENITTGGLKGSIRLLGGTTQGQRQIVYSGGDGYTKSYYYDTRLMGMAPPGFPLTGGFEIVSWLE
ncbi:MAG: hypothetical protein KA247_04575 [Bacteroidetes bacterium]|nr:hypothetical protein [Bacteroidota bacterium]